MTKIKLELHVSKHSRDKYQFEESLFETNGNAIVGNFNGARLFSQKINEKRDLINLPESAAKASEIYAVGLMDEIFHFIFEQYRRQINKGIFSQAAENLLEKLKPAETYKVIEMFLTEFPPLEVYRQEMTLTAYLESVYEKQAVSSILEEIILLWVENQNPALENYAELFRDRPIEQNSRYIEFIQILHIFFENSPEFGPDNQNLIDMLRAPAIVVPNSIPGQLEYIRTKWGGLIGDLIYRLLSGLDFLKEEEKVGFFGPGPISVPEYNQTWDMDIENFSPDKEWMPSLVIMAKNTYVWLDQLSQKYQKEIKRLDQIPDAELDLLRDRGFSGLWLIGLWERSKASAKIKQLCGNSEAIASAYSLAGYEIAWELGGDAAYQNLRERAWRRGVRLASDMVPNHMGIDSQWVYDHPEWFVHLPYSPYPSYTFNGLNLSSVANIDIKLEDHYYDRTDAAVVFRYHNHSNGQTKFIYHGNDGTTMPWNDTAQLDYLKTEVREAVYQTILSVARKFPIIRFDAAMTLAKKHYQRLWFPEPGTGGAIPSRAEFGLTKEQFDKIMPIEFWREVVDRLAVDAPDTLLLAEAFWLMESYFVRTLGMHRVYNSAFMNMLRNEDNANYRILIKNTLEFDPQILKRFVNFMNNPDEKTAVEQFGKGDKYFGICTIMSTLPGLPMFGHGQVEGFAEKYGMEFHKAYWDEKTDEQLVNRHNQQIFPVLHRRWIFSDVENFLLYDFFSPDHYVNEDVYAYSNYIDGQASLVVYNNRFSNAQGWIKISCAYSDKTGEGQKILKQSSFAEGVRLDPGLDFVIFRDIGTNLEYIRPTQELIEKGLYLELHPYQSHVFADFRQIKDDDYRSYRQLNSYLNGKGVPQIEEALKELLLQPVQNPLKQILNKGYFDFLLAHRLDEKINFVRPELIKEANQKAETLINGIYTLTGHMEHKDLVLSRITQILTFELSLPVFSKQFPGRTGKNFSNAMEYFEEPLLGSVVRWLTLLSYAFISPLGSIATPTNPEFQTQSWFGEWQFAKILRELANQYEITEIDQQTLVQSVYTLVGIGNWYATYQPDKFTTWIKELFNRQEIQQFLKINRYQGILWFNKERFEMLTWWLFTLAVMNLGTNPKISSTSFLEEIFNLHKFSQKMLEIMEKSEYRVEYLINPKA
jgi:glycosidase